MKIRRKVTRADVAKHFLLMVEDGLYEMDMIRELEMSPEDKAREILWIFTEDWERDYCERNRKHWLYRRLRAPPPEEPPETDNFVLTGRHRQNMSHNSV
jgi:hypothetical protein